LLIKEIDQMDIEDLNTMENPTWCPGCGNYSLVSAIRSCIADLGWKQEDTVIISGIGCGSKLPHYVNVYGFEGLHGRTLPVATGVKLANHKLHVIAVSGDGDGYGIGANHFLHTLRRNIDITYIVQNNEVYGLTQGQTSPTSPKGYKSPSTPHGAIEEPLNPIALAVVGGATYVARAYAFDPKSMKELLLDGMRHKGFSLIDVCMPCFAFNKVITVDWFKQHMKQLSDINHNPSDKFSAIKYSYFDNASFYFGLFYHEQKKTYNEELEQLRSKPLIKQDIKNIDISKFIKEFE